MPNHAVVPRTALRMVRCVTSCTHIQTKKKKSSKPFDATTLTQSRNKGDNHAPPSLYYIPDFITESEESILLNKVNSAPKPKWTQLSHRKLQNYGGLPHPKGMIPEPLPPWLMAYTERIFELGVFEDKVPNHVLVNEYLPGQGIMPHEDGPLFYPTVSTISLGSHTVLDFYYHLQRSDASEKDRLNEEYRPSRTDVVETLQESCGDESDFSPQQNRHFLSVLLQPRSLILVCDDMYKIYMHGIEERTHDLLTDKVANLDVVAAKEGDILERTTRVSLTIRHVPKVLKTKMLFGKR